MKSFDSPLIKCPLCSSEDIFHYHTVADNIRIFKCRSCGVQFMNPQYSDSYLSEYYSGYNIDNPKWEEPLVYCHNYYLSIIEKYVQKAKLLDVGAGNGYLIQAAIRRGWDAEGYDVDAVFTKKLSDKYKIKVCDGDFTSLKLDSEAYSAVTLHHVIEHLKDPLQYIKKFRQILKPGGILFIAMPNIHSRSALFKLLMERIGIRKRNMGAYYDTEHHLFYYTPASLKNFVEANGFKILYTKSGHAAKPDQSKFKRYILRNFSDRLLWKSTFIAICKKNGLVVP